MKTKYSGSGLLYALGALGALLAWSISQRWGIFLIVDAGPVLALLIGGALGVLVGWCLQLSDRLAALERRLASAGDQQRQRPDPAAKLDAPLSAGASPAVAPAGTPSRSTASAIASAAPKASTAPARAAPVSGAAQPSALRSWRLPTWLFAGNLPVRIGVLVLLVGVAALLRYVTEQGWLDVPIEVRLGAVALAGLAGLVFGWRQRLQRRAFALAVQGGAIGVLLLTLFAAYRLYAVIPAELAFAATVTLVFGMGVLAALQRAQWLAVFGMLAGFAAPFLIGDGQTGPGPMFAWFGVLNLGVFGLAWMQHWPLLSRLGFGFTFVLAALWGVLAWSSAHEWLALNYLTLFFLLYFLIPILEARRAGADSRVDGVLVFGLPLIALPLYALVVDGDRSALSFATLIAAALYLLSATLLIRRLQLPALGRAHAVLAIALATLAVPLTVSEYTVILIWALQGGALVWYGARQSARWTRWSGLLLQGLAGSVWVLLLLLAQSGSRWLLFHPDFYGGVALAVAGVVSAAAYQRAGAGSLRVGLLTTWAVVFWLVNGLHQIDAWLSGFDAATLGVAFMALSALLAAELQRRTRLIGTAVTSTAVMLLAGLLALQQLVSAAPLSGWGSLAWLALALTAVQVDRSLSSGGFGRGRLWHALAAHAAVLAALSASLIHVAGSTLELGDGWAWLLGAGPLLLLVSWLLSQRTPPLCLRTFAVRDQQMLLAASLLALVLGLLLSLAAPGAAAPLGWIPVLNPLELAQILSLMLALAALRLAPARTGLGPPLLAALVFLVISAMALRAVHQMGGIAWQLPALLEAGRAQAALTVAWTLLGTLAWLWGSRRARYAAWLAGAVLLGLVLLKLLLIDRSYLSTVAGILSFLAFGLLAIGIGFVAPAPPRAGREGDSER